MAVTPRRVLRFEMRGGSADDVLGALAELFRATGLSHDERVHLLGGAFVTETLRPYWVDGVTPIEAHERLRADDPELAAMIEAIAPILLGRTEARAEGAAAVEWVQSLLKHA
ncbi:MAG: hypothetical protein O3B31_05875 [Chloroflexi bacterium]|nr:hypothetical protein [Chloroflexota bacterium]MDA1002862.1 hypothetical protein [Chloroflexota bacterium]